MNSKYYFFSNFYWILGFGVHEQSMQDSCVGSVLHGSVLCFASLLHPHLAFLPMLSLPNSPPRTVPPLFPSDRPQCVMLPSLCPCVLIVQHPPMSENMRYFIFCSCVSLLRMMDCWVKWNFYF